MITKLTPNIRLVLSTEHRRRAANGNLTAMRRSHDIIARKAPDAIANVYSKYQAILKKKEILGVFM
jgi:hypothetical protein